MKDLINWPVVLRYLSGEGSPAERLRIATWIDEDPERRAYIESLRVIQDTYRDSAGDFDAAVAESKLSARLGFDLPGQLRDATTTRGTPLADQAAHCWRVAAVPAVGARLPVQVAWAAAVVILIAGGVLAGWRLRGRLGAREAAAREFVAARGQRETVTLIDGTQLTLAPASRLRVPVDYGRAARAVSLEGEGYFIVVHDAARPFEVRAGNAVVRDVGTAFDVRAYRDEPTVRVAVTDGRVALGSLGAAHGGVDLDAGETAAVGRSGVLGAVAHADVAMLTAWTTGTLAFHDTPLARVAQALSRWYGADVRVDATVADRPLTATYSGLSLAETIRLASAATGTRAAWRGNGAVALSAWPQPGR